MINMILDYNTKYFESRLKGRYITLEHIKPLLDQYKSNFEIHNLGFSVRGLDIPYLKVGTGAYKILAWSQMHGNESTTTKAIFDLLSYLKNGPKTDTAPILEACTLLIIPILNPDGAKDYERLNANKVDLNRDAKTLSQPESKLLHDIFNGFKPDLCLNLHGQRTIFGLSGSLKPATLSFLAPAADVEKSLTPSRNIAMALILSMNEMLQKLIPNQIGRYDDTFNPNCVGDAFQKLGAATILFEAGHFHEDYDREKIRAYVFYAYIHLLNLVSQPFNIKNTHKSYFLIPENTKNFCDIQIINARLDKDSEILTISIQFSETLIAEKIVFIPKIHEIGDSCLNAHKTIDAQGLICNNINGKAVKIEQTIEQIRVGDKVFDLLL